MIIDLVVIGFCLIFIAYGAIKGFKTQFFKIFIIFGSVMVAIFVAKPMAAVVQKTPIGEAVQTSITKTINNAAIGDVKIAEATVIKSGDTIYIDTNGINIAGGALNLDEALKALKAPEFLQSDIKTNLVHGSTLGEGVAPILSLYAITVGCAIALVIIMAIAITVIYIFVKQGVKKSKTLTRMDRALGSVFSLCFGFLILFGVFAVFNAAKGIAFMAPVYVEIEKSVLAKLLYEKNFLLMIFEEVFKTMTVATVV